MKTWKKLPLKVGYLIKIDEIFSPAMTGQIDQKQQKYKYHLSFLSTWDI